MEKIVNFIKNNQKLAVAISAGIVILASLPVYFYVYKSHGYLITRYDEVLLARNWSQTGFLSYENEKNTVIKSTDLAREGVPSTLGNKLTYYMYGYIFRWFNFSQSLPMYVAFSLYAISAALLFVLIRRLFGWELGLLSAGINLVAPFFLPYILSVGKTEFAYFFFTIGTLIYFWPVKNNKILKLILVAVFFALAVAARNSYFVAILPVAIMEFFFSGLNFRKRFKNAAILSVVYLLIAAPLAFLGGNSYIGLTLGGQKFESFHILDHLYPDPYTYAVEKDEYIDRVIASKQNSPLMEKFAFWGDSGMFLETFGSKPVGFIKGYLIPIVFSFVFYMRAFASLIVFGGGLVWLLVLFGAKKMHQDKTKKDFLLFSAVSLVCWYIALSITRTSNYSHYIMLIFPLAVLSAVGLLDLAKYIAGHFNLQGIKKMGLIIVFVIALLLPMAEISWWHMRDYFQNSSGEAAGEEFVKTHKAQDFPDSGTIAVGYFPKAPVLLNYYFDKNFIYFNPDTIKKIILQNKLDSVFKEYGVVGYVGYEKDMVMIIEEAGQNKYINYNK